MFKRHTLAVGFCAGLVLVLSIVHPTALFSQTQWNRLPDNPVLAVGTTGWDETIAVAGTVLRHGGMYKMWYEGDDSFGYATSDDGINWVKWPSNPVMEPGPVGSWDENNIDHPSVVIVGSTYHMFYSAEDMSNDNRIGHATSPDGFNWTRDPENPVIDIGTPATWDEFEAIHPFVIYDNGQFRMWYNGHDGITQRIIYATSPDGTNWTRYTALPMLEPGVTGSWDDDELGPMCVLIAGGSYHMWYTGWNTAGDFRIGYATSPNGLSWTKSPANPVLGFGSPGSWDDAAVTCPFVTYVDSLVMYYGGADGSLGQTGYAGTPSALVPALLQSYTAAWREAAIEISWTLSEASAGADMRFSVLRAETVDARFIEMQSAEFARSGLSFTFVDRTVQPGERYKYAVEVSDTDGRRTLFETEYIETPAATTAIERVSPNPFNPQTVIVYTISETAPVTLGIYDAAGRLVRTLVDAPRTSGRHTEQWDGLDDRGAAAASGVYFVRLESAGRVTTQKAVLMK